VLLVSAESVVFHEMDVSRLTQTEQVEAGESKKGDKKHPHHDGSAVAADTGILSVWKQ
jgi:hypothetical protein